MVWIAALPMLVAWPLPMVFTDEALSRPDTEAAIHIWGLWAAAVSGHPYIVDTQHMAWPDGFVGVLVDPLNLPAFLLGLLHGVPAAYNMTLYMGLVLAATAGALLARRAGGNPAVGAFVAAASPPLLTQSSLGMTETFTVGVVGLCLLALLRCLEHPSWRRVVLAGVALAACWYGGPYNGVWASLICVVVGIGALVRSPQRWRELLAALSGTGLVGVLLTAPLANAVLSLRVAGQPGTAAASRLQAPMVNADMFRGGLRNGADLTDPFLPVVLTGGEALASHTAYMGIVALSVAALAVWRRRALWPWLIGAFAVALVALGPWLMMRGHPMQGPGGARLMTPLGWAILAFPFLGRLTHWYRIGAVGVILLAVPVSVWARSWRRGLAVGGMIALDVALCAPMAWPLETTAVPDTAVFDGLDGAGAMLTLPESTTKKPNIGFWRDRIQLDQVHHGRPVAGLASWGGELSSSGAHAQMLVSGIEATGTLDRLEQAAFAGSGFRWLTVYHRRLQHDPNRKSRIDGCLGPPIATSRDVWIYSLERLRPEGCLGAKRDSMTVP